MLRPQDILMSNDDGQNQNPSGRIQMINKMNKVTNNP